MTSTGPSLYFLNQSAPEYIRTRSMVTIQEIQEEKMEDSSQLPPPEVSKSSTLGTNGTEPVTNEQHQKFDTEKKLLTGNHNWQWCYTGKKPRWAFGRILH
ncbi:hypothetical protein Ancab_000825 [Ancistrocladus abbreviatus]